MNTITNFQIKKMSLQLIVTNLEAAIDFYTQNLGFDIDFRYEDFYAGIIKDGYSIHLKLSNPRVEERQNKRKNEDLDLMIEVEGIEDIYNKMLNTHVEIIQPLRDMPYGKEFYIADLDGHIIAFLETA